MDEICSIGVEGEAGPRGQEYLKLRQGTKSMAEITKMFTERALLCPDFAASEQAQMTRYLSMIKTYIYQFVSTQRYATLMELQEALRMEEIEMELQAREWRQDPV